MAETTTMRIVPSGKIYRQMFDAQLQLNKSLTQKRPKSPTSRSTVSAPNSTSVPLVRLSTDETKHGVLTERQQTWVNGFPNDPHIENPVLYRQYADFMSIKIKEKDSGTDNKEVQALPDIVVPSKKGSDIIDRIASSRKERHEAAVEDMQQELNVISSNFEPRIADVSEGVLEKLQDDDKLLEELQNKIQIDGDLIQYHLDDLHTLWAEIQSHTPSRQGWIVELDYLLKTSEDDRLEQIRTVFETYSEKLEKIAHLMAPDLQKFLDKESQIVNQTMLSNRRAYADLFVRLMSADIEREKTQYSVWKRRKDDWSNLKTRKYVLEFKEYMKSNDVVKPESIDTVLEDMMEDQKNLNDKRIELIMSLVEMKPPMSTKTAVYKWNQTIQSVSTEIDNVNHKHLSKLHEEYEQICQMCIDQMNSIREKLMGEGICSNMKAQNVVDTEMLPLIGERQKMFEENLEIMENSLETHALTMTTDIKSLFKFAQGAAHVWDVHEIGLAKQERALQEKLENCRHTHDNKNQDTESMLDNIMDKMRQDATEQNLASSLVKALEMLERIRLSYEVFHQKQTDVVKTYPDMVSSELNNYDESVCKFFMVDRNHPDSLRESADSEDRESRASNSSQEEKKKERKTPTKKRRTAKKEKTDQETAHNALGISAPLKVWQEESAPGPLPMAVSEMLSTEKGTTFYVLTVAGKHGVHPDPVSSPGTPSSPASVKKPYITSVNIPKYVINDVKRLIRLNFINHLETWIEQAFERSSSVVVAKCEELNSELDLRLHLHQPRPKRAELDIHNVRAAELVMHSERVARHCKGIQQSLTDLRSRFTSVSHDHNKLANKFREDIEALEIVFINATKSSRLLALQNQLSVELEKFMAVIRTSLRQFRQHLDKNLQMLRESNARFIKSFKLFSDGGNFCPAEIEEYRKSLEKMSQKIDQIEGSIMSDLEGMESKRLDQGSKVATEFEDRFKSHMFDLVFMEKIARWLTNTQVKIKTEVADSNSQAQKLTKYIQQLDRRIDACENPNPDKEQITPMEIYDSLPDVFETITKRTEFLHCVKDTPPRPSSGSILQGNPATAARVGFISDITPISKAGRQPTEDPSLGVIKSILKPQKLKVKGGSESDFDAEIMPQMGASLTQLASNQPLESREKLKSAMSTSSGKGSTTSSTEKSKSGRRSQMTVIETAQQKRIQSAADNVPVVPISKPRKLSEGFRRMSLAARNQKASRFERKFMVFGEKEEEGENEFFTGIVKRLLREALDGILTTADLYYKTKGNRPVTRPQALQENFDGCAETVIHKLQSYFRQAFEYHNECLQEFRKQLRELEQLMSRVPWLVIGDIERNHKALVNNERKNVENTFSVDMNKLEKQQEEHQHLLRPSLGHPHQQQSLSELCEKETKRHEEYIQLVQTRTTELKSCIIEYCKKFLEVLSRTGENQLLQYDNLTIIDEVQIGKVPPKRHSTSELLRRKVAGEELEDGEEGELIPRGKGTWPGVAINEIVVDRVDRTELEYTATVSTLKTTLCHQAVVLSREQAYEHYKNLFESMLQEILVEKDQFLKAEDRWTESWSKSVQKVKDLY